MLSLGLSNFDPTDRSSIPVEVSNALGETATWCMRHSPPSDRQRSATLDPSAILIVPSLDQRGIHAFLKAKRESYRQAILALSLKRRELLRNRKAQVGNADVAQADGKLLLYDPLETVADGAAVASSHGFFDGDDAPPWNTWFWLANDTIFCWIPQSLVSDAQAGIDANPVDCIRWADWSELATLVRR